MGKRAIARANGSGSVYKLSGNRRKPWVAAVTEKWTDEGKQIRKILGTYATRDEALKALSDFNESPFDLNRLTCTFSDVYKAWSEWKFPTIKEKTIRNYKNAYSHCQPLWNMKFRLIKVDDLQNAVDNSGLNYPSMGMMKDLFGQLFRYGLPRDYCKTNYAQGVDLKRHEGKNPNTIEHTAFTSEEIEVLWTNADRDEVCKLVLMLIYSGLRAKEFLNLEKADVHLQEKYFDVTQSKTRNGIRSIPIPDSVISFWEYFLNRLPENDYLVTQKKRSYEEEKGYLAFLRTCYKPCMDRYGMNHLIHDCRHSFISLLQLHEVSDVKLRTLAGHAGRSLAEKTYTHFELEALREEINKIVS